MSACTRLLLSFALGMAAFTAAPAHASLFETLYKFSGGADGAAPTENLVSKDGMLYGTTNVGGIDPGSRCGGILPGCGTVFKLDPTTKTLTTLHAFTGGADGGNPVNGLVLDTTGVLYGTTPSGGSKGCGGFGCGTLFKLDPAGQTLTTLHAFDGADGQGPEGGLVFKDGILYGVTRASDFRRNGGTVFAFDLTTQKLTTLHSFCGLLPPCTDGYILDGTRLVIDTTGMIYGTTTENAGRAGGGTVFQLDPATQTFTTLHIFNPQFGGYFPEGGLVARNGKLFGTTATGGVSVKGHGTVFKLYPATHYLETLHDFTGSPDGFGPGGDLTADPAAQSGVLYGTTGEGGGGACHCGTVFKLKSATKKLTILHAFTTRADGAKPVGGVIFDTTGALYGSTFSGGNLAGVCGWNAGSGPNGCGTVFKLVP